MKHKFILLFTAIAFLTACAGCGNQAANEPYSQTQDQDSNKNISGGPENVNPANGGELFKIGKLTGSVTDISDNGCKITPTHIEGNVAYGAAPGYENPEELISITYSEDCIFQIAYMDIQAGTVTYDPATVNDVKKQTSLVICGEYDRNNVLHANRIFIYRIME